MMRKLKPSVMLSGLVVTLLTMATPVYAQHHGHDKPDAPEPTGLWSQAERYYDPSEMATSRRATLHHTGDQTNFYIMADRLELQFIDDEEIGFWDVQGWYGGDINKLWVKSEGNYSVNGNGAEEAEVQILWSHAIAPYFDFQMGLRYDFEPVERPHAVFSIQGVAPYWCEVDAAAFLSEEGDVTARFEAEYELLLSQRLILQPRIKFEFSAQDIPKIETGSGLTSINAGLRLRYEVVRELAPYIGVEWQRSLGETKNYVDAAGDDAERTVFVVGMRVWY